MSAPDTTADTSPLADAARIRELMLANLFAVFGERDRERRSKAIAANYTDDVICTAPDRCFAYDLDHKELTSEVSE